MSAMGEFKQPLCGNEEGWGPLSPFRYDFTPCFIDVWVASVAVFGILAGSAAIWWLVKRKQPSGISKDWHFWIKQVGKERRRERENPPPKHHVARGLRLAAPAQYGNIVY